MSATRRRRYSPQPGEEGAARPPAAAGPAPSPGGAGPAPAEQPRYVKECPFCRREIPEVALGLIALMPFVYFLVSDLLWLSASRRRDPASALKAFLRAMKIGRYREAYDCVLPGDRSARTRSRRAMREVGIAAARSTFQDLAGFRAYWEPVFGTPDTSTSISRPRTFSEQGDFATVSVGITLNRDAGGGGGIIGAAIRAATAGSATLSMRKLVRRVEGRWFLVTGELDSPEDGAMEEFAALAAAPDAQLVALSRAPAPAPAKE